MYTVQPKYDSHYAKQPQPHNWPFNRFNVTPKARELAPWSTFTQIIVKNLAVYNAF